MRELSYYELTIISNCLISAINDCDNASKLVSKTETIEAIKKEQLELSKLNIKICELMTR